MNKVIEYPSWHDEARKMAAQGASYAQVADAFGFPISRAGHILGPSWRMYLYVYRHSFHSRPSRDIAKSDIDNGRVTFKAVNTPSPKNMEQMVKATRKSARRIIDVEEEPMARLRTFTEVKELHENKILKGAKITCYKCGATETYFNFQGSVSTEYLPKEFTRRGWLVGKNERTDMCPSCVAKLRGPKQKPKTEEVIPQMSIQPAIAAAPVVNSTPLTPAIPSSAAIQKVELIMSPVKLTDTSEMYRPMDRTDRRLIFSRLNELYVDEKTGYSDEWTDAKVSEDLGVPVEWIAKVRDEDFGPELNASIRAKSFTDLQKLGESIERHIVLVDKKIEQMQSLDDKITTQMKLCNETVDRFEELCKSLETEDKRIEDILAVFNKDVEAFKKMFAELAGQASPK